MLNFKNICCSHKNYFINLHLLNLFLHCCNKFEFLFYSEVPITEASVVIAISSPHRKEALEAVNEAIYALKAKVPIWKKVFQNIFYFLLQYIKCIKLLFLATNSYDECIILTTKHMQ